MLKKITLGLVAMAFIANVSLAPRAHAIGGIVAGISKLTMAGIITTSVSGGGMVLTGAGAGIAACIGGCAGGWEGCGIGAGVGFGVTAVVVSCCCTLLLGGIGMLDADSNGVIRVPHEITLDGAKAIEITEDQRISYNNYAPEFNSALETVVTQANQSKNPEQTAATIWEEIKVKFPQEALIVLGKIAAVTKAIEMKKIEEATAH